MYDMSSKKMSEHRRNRQNLFVVVTRITRRRPHVEQELLIQEYMSSPPVFSRIRAAVLLDP